MLSILFFLMQVCLFGGLALYLHYFSEHYGYAALLFFVAGIMGVLNLVELITLFIEPVPGIVIRPGGHVYVPIILLVVLVSYITSGTRTARIIIGGLTGINVLIIGILLSLVVYVTVYSPGTTIQGLFAEANILTPLFLRGVVASTTTFAVNMFVIVIIYQGIKNAFPAFPESLIPGIAIIIALWVDAALYNILAFLGTDLFATGIPGDILMKTLAGLVLSPLVGWYITRVAPGLVHYVGTDDRSTFAIVFGEDHHNLRVVQLENELKVSRAIYEQLMHHIDGAFWLVDVTKERFLYLSPNFEKLTGTKPALLYKDPTAFLELVHPDDRAEGIVSHILHDPEVEFRIQQPDGGIRWLRNRAFPIVTKDKQIVRYAGITEDVTLRREAQAQAFALELSRERIHLLQQFVRDASHDLRTPLSAIMLKLDLMERVDAARQQELKQELRSVAKHLNHLIDDLFTLSRIEGEENHIQEPVDFNAVVRQVVDNQQIIAKEKNLDLIIKLTDSEATLAGNREQLFRVVTNLIGNAIYYTTTGTITVTTCSDDKQITLEVTDTGIGISENHLKSIFDRFYRTDQARTIRYDGTGLGLAISKAIVEQHQGSITVQSNVGVGTTFKVTFPVNEALTE